MPPHILARDFSQNRSLQVHTEVFLGMKHESVNDKSGALEEFQYKQQLGI